VNKYCEGIGEKEILKIALEFNVDKLLELLKSNNVPFA